MSPSPERQTIMGPVEVEETLERLADEVLAGRGSGGGGAVPEAGAESKSGAESGSAPGSGGGGGEPILVGIRRRGVELARRLSEIIAGRLDGAVPTGSMDITLYRDDFGQVGPRPVIGTTELPGEITGTRVVIIDDVLFTGRTVRAALDQLSDFGRPSRVELCVLVDRGGRELPIQPDYVGRRVEVPEGWEVAVRVPELDGDLGVALVPLEATP